MNTLKKENHTVGKLFRDSTDTSFGRTIDDILSLDFFNSFDASIREEHDSYRLEIAVPGMTRKDITIHIDGSVMWVSAQKQEKNNSLMAMEFNSRHFQRSFALPAEADTNNIKAKCRNGLLTIRIGKIKAKKMHRVIRIGGEETNTTISDKITSRWSRLMEKANQLFKRKR